MYEYFIRNIKTGEESSVMGRCYETAMERAHLDPNEWEYQMYVYID